MRREVASGWQFRYPPLLSFCLSVRNASAPSADGAPFLENCLASLRRAFPDAEIVIVDTMSNDFPVDEELTNCHGVFEGGVEYSFAICTICGKRLAFHRNKPREPKTVTIARAYADVFEEWTGPKGEWNREMYAVDDMAAARNRTFELAHGEWLCWVDADDVLPGPGETIAILEANGRATDTPLRSIEEHLREVDPSIDGFWCPYAYRFAEGPYMPGVTRNVAQWNPRERIVRNNGKWFWTRPAHETLTPRDPADAGKLAPAHQIVFAHAKKFTPEDEIYAARRHFAILIKLHEAGEADCQDLLYLDGYAATLCPERRAEFLRTALAVARTPIEAARVNIKMGRLYEAQGNSDRAAVEYAEATILAPDFPDGHMAYALLYDARGVFALAGASYMRVVAAQRDHPWSEISPRAQAINARVLAALAYRKAALRVPNGARRTAFLDAAHRAITEARAQPYLGAAAGDVALYAEAIEKLREGA